MVFDTHCHFPHAKYKKSAEEVVQNAKDAGVDLLMNIGTSLKESRRAVETTEKFENVYCSVGIYPHDDREKTLDVLCEKLEAFLSQSDKIRAIGEIGFDISNWENGRSPQNQLELFEMQAGLAIKHNLPIIIHNRNGDELILSLVGKHSASGLLGICHCFTQDWEYAQKMLDYGFYLGFGGIVTYPPSHKATEGQGRSDKSDINNILEVLRKMPLDRILVETDAPYLLPEPLRAENKGGVNEPKNVVLVAKKIAEIRSMSYDEICQITYENGKRLFKID